MFGSAWQSASRQSANIDTRDLTDPKGSSVKKGKQNGYKTEAYVTLRPRNSGQLNLGYRLADSRDVECHAEPNIAAASGLSRNNICSCTRQGDRDA